MGGVVQPKVGHLLIHDALQRNLKLAFVQVDDSNLASAQYRHTVLPDRTYCRRLRNAQQGTYLAAPVDERKKYITYSLAGSEIIGKYKSKYSNAAISVTPTTYFRMPEKLAAESTHFATSHTQISSLSVLNEITK